MKTWPLLVGLCLLARATLGEQVVASFAKRSLGLDLTTIPFGTNAPANGEYEKAEPPGSPLPMTVDTAVNWTTNAMSGKYHSDFPQRILRFGFREGRLVAVRISISVSGGTWSNPKLLKQEQQELIHIQDELAEARKIQKKINSADDRFRIQYGAMCSTHPDSLFNQEIEITPVAAKKAP